MNRCIVFVALMGMTATAAAQPLLIENVTVLSSGQAHPPGNQYVLVRDGRIAAVSDHAIVATYAR